MWGELFVDAPIGDSGDCIESERMVGQDFFGHGGRRSCVVSGIGCTCCGGSGGAIFVTFLKLHHSVRLGYRRTAQCMKPGTSGRHAGGIGSGRWVCPPTLIYPLFPGGSRGRL